jgi:hypothetical protein
MTSRRMITSILTVLMVGAPAALPAVATAGSLLSGYGGPGQGNQAILGSALLNGPSSGGGGGGGSTGAGGSVGAGPLSGTSNPVASSRPQGTRARHHSTSSRPSSGTGSLGVTSPGGSGAYPLSTGLARAVSGDSRTLGLSGADLLYILLALAALALTGLATRQLMRGHEGQEGTVAKGMRPRIRGTE